MTNHSAYWNTKWRNFLHSKLITHYGNVCGKSFLDYGCGHGNLVQLLLQENVKSVCAVDPDITRLQTMDILNDNRLEKIATSDPLQLKGKKFDGIFCHNVLENIEDKAAFLNNLVELLEPGGSLIISHNDFDSMIYNSSFKHLTRNLIHLFSDHMQDWQSFTDGQVARKIPGLIADYKKSDWALWRITEADFTPVDYGYGMVEMIIEAAKGEFSEQELLNWKGDLQSKAGNKDYIFAIDVFVGRIQKSLI